VSYLSFQEVANPRKLTKRWVILSSLETNIGWIEFHAPWRKYIWVMAPGIIFDVSCTEEVVAFLKLHKDDRQ